MGVCKGFPYIIRYYFFYTNLIIGASRNWCKTARIESCCRSATKTSYAGLMSSMPGRVPIDGDFVIRNPVYYIVAHASKFVRPDR